MAGDNCGSGLVYTFIYSSLNILPIIYIEWFVWYHGHLMSLLCHVLYHFRCQWGRVCKPDRDHHWLWMLSQPQLPGLCLLSGDFRKPLPVSTPNSAQPLHILWLALHLPHRWEPHFCTKCDLLNTCPTGKSHTPAHTVICLTPVPQVRTTLLHLLWSA